MVVFSVSSSLNSVVYLTFYQFILFAFIAIFLTIRLYNRTNSVSKSLAVYSVLIAILVVIEHAFQIVISGWITSSGWPAPELGVLVIHFVKTTIIVMITFIVVNYYRSIAISINSKYNKIISILGLSTILPVMLFSTIYALYLMSSDYGRCDYFGCVSYMISTPVSKFVAPYIIAIFLALYIIIIVYKINKNSVIVKIIKYSMYVVQYIIFIPIIYIILFERWHKYRDQTQGAHPFDYVEINSVIVMGILTLLCYFITNIMLTKINTNNFLVRRVSLLLFPASIFILLIMIIFGYKPTGGIYTG